MCCVLVEWWRRVCSMLKPAAPRFSTYYDNHRTTAPGKIHPRVHCVHILVVRTRLIHDDGHCVAGVHCDSNRCVSRNSELTATRSAGRSRHPLHRYHVPPAQLSIVQSACARVGCVHVQQKQARLVGVQHADIASTSARPCPHGLCATASSSHAF